MKIKWASILRALKNALCVEIVSDFFIHWLFNKHLKLKRCNTEFWSTTILQICSFFYNLLLSKKYYIFTKLLGPKNY